MAWILILWMTSTANGPPIASVEFADKAACEAALDAIRKSNMLRDPNGICVPKSSTPPR